MSRHILLLCLGTAFGLAELALSLRKRSRADAARTDRGSRHVLWIVIVSAWVLAFILAADVMLGHFRVGPALLGVSLLAFAGGLALRWYAILYLGRLFTVDVAIAPDHRLIDRGPYRWIRHPSYAGALLAFLGLGLCLGSLPALAMLLIPTAAAYRYRIAVEESALSRELGHAYSGYVGRTWRLLPGIY